MQWYSLTDSTVVLINNWHALNLQSIFCIKQEKFPNFGDKSAAYHSRKQLPLCLQAIILTSRCFTCLLESLARLVLI